MPQQANGSRFDALHSCAVAVFPFHSGFLSTRARDPVSRLFTQLHRGVPGENRAEANHTTFIDSSSSSAFQYDHLLYQIVTHVSELMTLKKMPTFSEVKSGKDALSIPLTA